MKFPDSEKTYITCPDCKGTGEQMVTVSTGYISQTTKKIECKTCEGKKTVLVTPVCHYRLSESGTYMNPYRKCIGDECMLWDRIDGGCLHRKALLNQCNKTQG